MISPGFLGVFPISDVADFFRSRLDQMIDQKSALQYSGNPHEYWLGERLSGGGISQKLV
jgi:hypothetical protein